MTEEEKTKKRKKFWGAGFTVLKALKDLNGDHESAPVADGHIYKRYHHHPQGGIDFRHPEEPWYN